MLPRLFCSAAVVVLQAAAACWVLAWHHTDGFHCYQHIHKESTLAGVREGEGPRHASCMGHLHQATK